MATILRLNTSLVSADLISTDKTPIEGATVTATLKDKEGVDVVGAINIPMPETSAGTYEAQLSDTLSLPDCQYFLHVTGTELTGEVLFTVVTCNVEDNKS